MDWRSAPLQWIVISVPAAAAVFRVAPLTARGWGIACGISLMPVVLNEMVKLIRRPFRGAGS